MDSNWAIEIVYPNDDDDNNNNNNIIIIIIIKKMKKNHQKGQEAIFIGRKGR